MSESPNQGPAKRPSQNPSQPRKNGKPKININWLYAALIAGLLAVNFFSGPWEAQSYDVSWYELEQMLKQDDVKKIVVVNNRFAEIFIKPEKVTSDTTYKRLESKRANASEKFFVHKFINIETFESDIRQTQKTLQESQYALLSDADKLSYRAPAPVELVPEERRNIWMDVLSFAWPVLLIVLMIFFFTRMSKGAGGSSGGGMFSFGKSKAQLFDEKSATVTFSDVAGLAEAKVEVMEIVDFLKNPSKYTELGGKIPKGALLVGPPGTGKTLLAKAVAGEAKVPFFSISGSDFVEMFVGVGASRVRDLFQNAKAKAPCIIFIDEIDAIGRARGRSAFSGSNDERENTLNQLLTEMDGFGTNSGVIILAATNRADILDKALLRAGRFDRQIYVELPELDERKAIFLVHLKNLKLNTDIEVDFLAKQTPGFSGADIANVCNEAALIAARRSQKMIGKKDFLDAVDRIVGGLEKRSKIITPNEKKTIAYHEAGHAAVSWLLRYAHPLVKVTIVPRGKSLGAAWYLPEERQITTVEQMKHEMIATLGGRAAEEVVFGCVSTGALNDLEKITKQAYAMVAYYGMDSEIGNLSFYDSSGEQEMSLTKPYSEKTAEQIDKAVHRLIEDAYLQAKELLQSHRSQVDCLAETLIKEEVIFRDHLEQIFGPRPFDIPSEPETPNPEPSTATPTP